MCLHDVEIDLELHELKELDPDIRASITAVRQQARDIVLSLDPAHISSWGDLFAKLESVKERAKQEYELQNWAEKQKREWQGLL